MAALVFVFLLLASLAYVSTVTGCDLYVRIFFIFMVVSGSGLIRNQFNLSPEFWLIEKTHIKGRAEWRRTTIVHYLYEWTHEYMIDFTPSKKKITEILTHHMFEVQFFLFRSCVVILLDSWFFSLSRPFSKTIKAPCNIHHWTLFNWNRK